VNQTKDHSVVQALVEAGELDPEDQRDHDASHRILRALGDSDAANPDVADDPVSVQPGDAFLLCSDGFWEAVHEDDMLAARADASSPEDWIDTMAAPIEAADEAEQDNYTAAAVFVDR
jgi:serine/threonine protein phosphatase PrpC